MALFGVMRFSFIFFWKVMILKWFILKVIQKSSASQDKFSFKKNQIFLALGKIWWISFVYTAQVFFRLTMFYPFLSQSFKLLLHIYPPAFHLKWYIWEWLPFLGLRTLWLKLLYLYWPSSISIGRKLPSVREKETSMTYKQ